MGPDVRTLPAPRPVQHASNLIGRMVPAVVVAAIAIGCAARGDDVGASAAELRRAGDSGLPPGSSSADPYAAFAGLTRADLDGAEPATDATGEPNAEGGYAVLGNRPQRADEDALDRVLARRARLLRDCEPEIDRALARDARRGRVVEAERVVRRIVEEGLDEVCATREPTTAQESTRLDLILREEGVR